MDKVELESRLQNWADEYGGGRYPNIGWQGANLLQTLVEHQGFVPNGGGYVRIPIRSLADEVEHLVRGMEDGDLHKAAKAMRCDYFLPNISIQDRLLRMRKIGISISRAGYYDILAQGKCYLRGALSRKAA